MTQLTQNVGVPDFAKEDERIYRLGAEVRGAEEASRGGVGGAGGEGGKQAPLPLILGDLSLSSSGGR